jgi:hypothetical protein
MLEIKVSYLIEDFEENGDPLHKSSIFNILEDSIILQNIRNDIADLIADTLGVFLFSESAIMITSISIIRGSKIDSVIIDQSESIILKNTQNTIIPIKKIETTEIVSSKKIHLTGFDFTDTEIKIICEILDIDGNSNLFPNITDSRISILNIHPTPKFHYFSGSSGSCMRIKRSVIDKIKIRNACVGNPPEIISRILKGYRRIDNQDVLSLEDSSLISTLDIHEIEFHGPNTSININTDGTSKILNIEISDNTKIKNRCHTTD